MTPGGSTAAKNVQNNRVSKQILREPGSGGNLKEYGMSIITGGKPSSSGGLGLQTQNKTPLKNSKALYSNIEINEREFHTTNEL